MDVVKSLALKTNATGLCVMRLNRTCRRFCEKRSRTTFFVHVINDISILSDA